jgi:putative MFS transporter
MLNSLLNNVQPVNERLENFNFDYILENKLGFGRYQIIAILFLCLVDFNDGVELLSMSILMPILKNEWQISNFWVEVLSSIFYLGMFVGALLTGRIADIKGRKFTLIYASTLQFLIAFSFSLINSIPSFLILRFLYGFCYGFSLPLTISLVSEIVPLKYRGKGIIFTNFCVSLGKLWGIFLSWIILSDMKSGNWRLLMICCSFTSLIVIYGLVTYVKESPRFLISIGSFDEANEIISYIGFQNKGESFIPLSEQEKIQLENAYTNTNTYKKEEQANPSALFNETNYGITIKLWIIWFALIFVEFGQYVLLPFILISQKSGFGTLMLAVIGEIPAIFFSFYFIDTKFGRKHTLTICVIAFGFLNLLAYISNKTYLGYIISVERFFMKNCFSMLIPLTSELYSTNYRTVGYGYATSVGRIAATISPYILLPLFNYDTYSGFILFSILSFIAAYSSHLIPYDTTNKYLDSVTN